MRLKRHLGLADRSSKQRALMLLIGVATLAALWLGAIPAATAHSTANTLVIQDGDMKLPLDEYLWMKEDDLQPARQLDAVIRDHEDFQQVSGPGRPNYGYDSSIGYWFRVQLDNQSQQAEWLLEMSAPKTNMLYLYTFDRLSGEWQETETGNSYPFWKRDIPHRNFVFRLDLEPGEQHTLYLWVRTGGSIQMPLTLWSEAAHSEKTQVEYGILGLLFGVSLMLAVYHLVLYLSLRDPSYLYYVLFVVANAVLILADNGLGYQFLWQKWEYWNRRSVTSMMLVSNMFGLGFAVHFLAMKQYARKWFRVSVGAISIMLLVLALRIWEMFTIQRPALSEQMVRTLNTVNPYILYIVLTLTLLTIVLMLGAGIRAWRSGFRAARYFMMAWGFFTLGVVISILTDAGLLPLTLLTKYAWQGTTIVEAMLLAFALGDRYRLMREEKHAAEREARSNEQLALKSLQAADRLKDEHNRKLLELNRSLEEKVQARTFELEEKNQKLSESEQSRRHLLANIAHELGTPITLIQSYAQAVRDQVIQADDARYLAMVEARAKVLERLTGELYDLSRLEAGRAELMLATYELRTWLGMTLQQCEQQVIQAGRKFKLKDTLSEQLLRRRICLDQERVLQVFSNLVDNAIAHTEVNSGEISLSIAMDAERDHVLVAVHDNGSGIATEHVGHIFERFYRVLPEQRATNGQTGTGLGLAIVREIVQQHQGETRAESEPGVGSSFYISLPLEEE